MQPKTILLRTRVAHRPGSRTRPIRQPFTARSHLEKTQMGSEVMDRMPHTVETDLTSAPFAI